MQTREGAGNLESQCVSPQVKLGFTQTFEFSQTPSRVHIRLCKHGKRIFLKYGHVIIRRREKEALRIYYSDSFEELSYFWNSLTAFQLFLQISRQFVCVFMQYEQSIACKRKELPQNQGEKQQEERECSKKGYSQKGPSQKTDFQKR